MTKPTPILALVCLLSGWLPGFVQADLVHHYRFDSDASDSVGTAHGTLINGASVSGGVLNLDGTNDYVQFNTYLVPGSGSYSVALFAKWTGGSFQLAEMISQGYSGGPGFFLGIKDSGGEIRATDTWQTTGVFYPNDGQSHHFALTVDSSANQSYLYLDGSLSATFASALTTAQASTFTRFGRQFQTWSEYFQGTLDDVRVYNHTLSALDVANLAGVPEPGSAAIISGLMLSFVLTNRHRRLIHG